MHNVQSGGTDDASIEQQIQAKGLTAPRLTPDHINEQIVHASYHVFPGTTVTVCCLTMRNGFNTVGHSAAVSPENFDEDIGRKVAYEKAKNEIWQLEGYLLKDFLHANRNQGRRDSDVRVVGEDTGQVD